MCSRAREGVCRDSDNREMSAGSGSESLTEECVPCPPPTASLQGSDYSCQTGPPASPPLLAAPSYPSGEGQAGRRRKQGRVLWDWESVGRASGALCGVAGKEGGESRDEGTPSRPGGLGLSLDGLGPRTVRPRPLHGPPRSAVTSRSRPPPRGGGAFPLCGPGAPGPAPGPLPPGRSLPGGGGGGGVRGAALRTLPGRCPFPRVDSLPCPPARGPPGPSCRCLRSPAGDRLSCPVRLGCARPPH